MDMRAILRLLACTMVATGAEMDGGELFVYATMHVLAQRDLRAPGIW